MVWCPKLCYNTVCVCSQKVVMTAITVVMLILNILFMADLTINHKAHSELGY